MASFTLAQVYRQSTYPAGYGASDQGGIIRRNPYSLIYLTYVHVWHLVVIRAEQGSLQYPARRGRKIKDKDAPTQIGIGALWGASMKTRSNKTVTSVISTGVVRTL